VQTFENSTMPAESGALRDEQEETQTLNQGTSEVDLLAKVALRHGVGIVVECLWVQSMRIGWNKIRKRSQDVAREPRSYVFQTLISCLQDMHDLFLLQSQRLTGSQSSTHQ
jgi:hypothetical protein